MGLDDVLADEMLGLRPKFHEELFSSMFQRTHIVDECIKPYVGHVALIEGDLDAPVKTALGTGDAQVTDGLA